MGTRNLISVVIDGQTKVAQYGQWDGYLSGQGQDIVDFLSGLSKAERKQFKENVRKCTFISGDEVEAKLNSVGSASGLITMEESDRIKKALPELHRDTGADILKLILDKPQELVDSSDFANDDLFCEFAYVIDLDAEVLRIYTGGRNPLGEVRLVDLPEAFDELVALDEAEAEA